MAEQFKFVGVSRRPNGELQVRYANDANRVKVLARCGDTDIHFIELLDAGSKMDCVDALMDYCESAEDLDGEFLAVVAEEAEALGFDLSRC